MGATEFLTPKFNSTHPPLSSASRQSKVRLYAPEHETVAARAKQTLLLVQWILCVRGC